MRQALQWPWHPEYNDNKKTGVVPVFFDVLIQCEWNHSSAKEQIRYRITR